MMSGLSDCFGAGNDAVNVLNITMRQKLDETKDIRKKKQCGKQRVAIWWTLKETELKPKEKKKSKNVRIKNYTYLFRASIALKCIVAHGLHTIFLYKWRTNLKIASCNRNGWRAKERQQQEFIFWKKKKKKKKIDHDSNC